MPAFNAGLRKFVIEFEYVATERFIMELNTNYFTEDDAIVKRLLREAQYPDYLPVREVNSYLVKDVDSGTIIGYGVLD